MASGSSLSRSGGTGAAGGPAGALRPILRSLIARLAGGREALLAPELAVETIAAGAVADFSALGRRDARDWAAILPVLDGLVAEALADEADGAPVAIPAGGGSGSLGAWLMRFHATMRAVQPMALRIVALRVEGYRDRDIAERLQLGPRLVRRIVGDARAAWRPANAGGAAP